MRRAGGAHDLRGECQARGVRVSVGIDRPVPDNCSVWVPTESVMVREPLLGPDAVGEKVIPMVHAVLGARSIEQVLALT